MPQILYLSVLLFLLIISTFYGFVNGIVHHQRRTDFSSSEKSYRSLSSDSLENSDLERFSSELASSSKSVQPYSVFGRDQQSDGDQQTTRYSEGGGLLLDNHNDNFGYDNESPLDRREEQDEKVKWKGWNYLDTSKGWTPHEKTLSFQFMDDDGRYTHSPPNWPHDEYMLQYPYISQNFGLRNASSTTTGTDNDKAYEWQKLHTRLPVSPGSSLQKGHFIGPGFYDFGSNQILAHNPSFPSHQSITDSSVSVASSSSGGSSFNGDGQIPNAVSESANHGKLFPGGGGGAYGGLSPYDYYRRKRLRLKIHPGILVAPIAGFAAYKAVSAIASKPLLFELGWVGNKPTIDVGAGWGGGFPVQQRPPVYPYPGGYPYPPVAQIPYPYPPTGSFGEAGGQQLVPILRPRKKPDSQRSWWNPFAALSPRFRNKKDDRTCCNEEDEQEKRQQGMTDNNKYGSSSSYY